MLVMDKVKIIFVLCFCFFFWCLVERIDTFPYLDYILLPTSIFVFLFLFFFPVFSFQFSVFSFQCWVLAVIGLTGINGLTALLIGAGLLNQVQQQFYFRR